MEASQFNHSGKLNAGSEGEKNTMDTVYCIRCGRQIKGEIKSHPIVYCTQCGALLDNGYDYCIHCGSWMH